MSGPYFASVTAVVLQTVRCSERPRLPQVVGLMVIPSLQLLLKMHPGILQDKRLCRTLLFLVHKCLRLASTLNAMYSASLPLDTFGKFRPPSLKVHFSLGHQPQNPWLFLLKTKAVLTHTPGSSQLPVTSTSCRSDVSGLARHRYSVYIDTHKHMQN